MDTSTKQKITKETQALNDTMDQVDLIDIYRAFHPTTMDLTFFSCVHGTSSRIEHILDHKSSLGKFLKIKTISSIFSAHNAGRLDVNYGVGRGETLKKKTQTWRLNSTLLNKQQITEEILKCIETNDNENTTTHKLWD